MAVHTFSPGDRRQRQADLCGLEANLVYVLRQASQGYIVRPLSQKQHKLHERCLTTISQVRAEIGA